MIKVNRRTDGYSELTIEDTDGDSIEVSAFVVDGSTYLTARSKVHGTRIPIALDDAERKALIATLTLPGESA